MNSIKFKNNWLIGTIVLLSSFFVQSDNKKVLMGIKRPNLVGSNFNLSPKAATAFINMCDDAAKSGIKIYSQSSYRSYAHQKNIWERKYKRYIAQGESPKQAIRHIIQYSTIPGTSRHHWGTDLDIIDLSAKQPHSLLNANNFQKDGAYETLYKWMNANINRYGFYEVYTNDSTRKGFNYEPWHISFREEAKKNLQEYLLIDIKKELMERKLLGSDYFDKDFLEQYQKENILGINPLLIP